MDTSMWNLTIDTEGGACHLGKGRLNGFQARGWFAGCSRGWGWGGGAGGGWTCAPLRISPYHPRSLLDFMRQKMGVRYKRKSHTPIAWWQSGQARIEQQELTPDVKELVQ